MKDNKKNQLMYYILPVFMMGITTIIFYFVHKEFVFVNDDVYYSTNLATGEALKNLSEIFESQVWHYFNWGGRTVAHFLLQVTLFFGETFANVSNLLFTGLLLYLIAILTKQKSIWNHILILSLLVLCNPNWAETLFWQSGFANYIYTTIIVLVYLILYIRQAEKPESKTLFGINFWIVPLGLMAGWSNENIGPAVFLCTLGLLIYMRKKKYKTPIWMWSGNLFTFLGSVLVIIAPGNQARADFAYAHMDYGTLKNVLLRFYHIAVAIYHYLFPILLVLAVVAFFYIVILKNKITVTDVVFFALAVMSVGAMILSPHYPDRATFGTLVSLVIIVIRMLSDIIKNFDVKRIYYLWFIFVMWVGTLFRVVEYVLNIHDKIPYA